MDWEFGLIMMVMGMTVTLVTLFLLGWIIRLMIRIFPVSREGKKRE